MFKGRRPANSEQSEPDSISETHQRVFYVLDQIINTIPDEMKDHPMAKMLSVFAREGKKDLKRIPAPFITSLAQEIGEAFLWVANGSMSDLDGSEPTDIETEAESEHS